MNKYIRNPRQKGWMLCKRLSDGRIACLADLSMFQVDFRTSIGMMWNEPKSAEYYLKMFKNKEKDNDIFVTRVNSKNCPIRVLYSEIASRSTKGNVYFITKSNK